MHKRILTFIQDADNTRFATIPFGHNEHWDSGFLAKYLIGHNEHWDSGFGELYKSRFTS